MNPVLAGLVLKGENMNCEKCKSCAFTETGAIVVKMKLIMKAMPMPMALLK
jgi:hypothetical protein